VASGEVGQQRRSQGHRGCRGRTPCRRWSGVRWAPGGARPSALSLSPLRVAARRPDGGGDRPRARRVEAAGQESSNGGGESEVKGEGNGPSPFARLYQPYFFS